LLLRPLKGLLGVYIPDPIPGVLVTSQRPLSIQRFTAAHELGHYRLKHKPSLDDESILTRMATLGPTSADGPDMQEVEADAFAVAFLMPRWLILAHCARQKWLVKDLTRAPVVYQLALRLGVSYSALTWTLQRLNLITAASGISLRAVQPRDIKRTLLGPHKPESYHGDVWQLTERDNETFIAGSRNDHFVLKLNEHSGGGYLWDFDQLKASGFAILQDHVEDDEPQAVGGNVVRSVTAAPAEPILGEVSIREARPWQKNTPIAKLALNYDLTGPEQVGLSRVERSTLLRAA
jgi:Zn-dependent peptidase ImmA (M78 family)/predicted secreted protein